MANGHHQPEHKAISVLRKHVIRMGECAESRHGTLGIAKRNAIRSAHGILRRARREHDGYAEYLAYELIAETRWFV